MGFFADGQLKQLDAVSGGGGAAESLGMDRMLKANTVHNQPVHMQAFGLK